MLFSRLHQYPDSEMTQVIHNWDYNYYDTFTSFEQIMNATLKMKNNQTFRVWVNSPEKQPMKTHIRKVSTPRITVSYVGHFWKTLTFLYYRVLVQLATRRQNPCVRVMQSVASCLGPTSSSKLWIARFIYPLISWEVHIKHLHVTCYNCCRLQLRNASLMFNEKSVDMLCIPRCCYGGWRRDSHE